LNQIFLTLTTNSETEYEAQEETQNNSEDYRDSTFQNQLSNVSTTESDNSILSSNQIKVDNEIFEVKNCHIANVETQKITNESREYYNYSLLRHNTNNQLKSPWKVGRSGDCIHLKTQGHSALIKTPQLSMELFASFETILPLLYKYKPQFIKSKLISTGTTTETNTNTTRNVDFSRYLRNYNNNKARTNIKNLRGLTKELETEFQQYNVDFLDFIRYIMTRQSSQNILLSMANENKFRRNLLRQILQKYYPNYNKEKLAEIIITKNVKAGFIDYLRKVCGLDFLYCSKTVTRYISLLYDKIRREFQVTQYGNHDSFSIKNLSKAVDLFKKKAQVEQGDKFILESSADAAGIYTNHCITTHGYLFHATEFQSHTPENYLITNVFQGKDSFINLTSNFTNSDEMKQITQRSDVESVLGVYDYGLLFELLGEYCCASCGEESEEWSEDPPSTESQEQFETQFLQSIPIPIEKLVVDLLHLEKNITMNLLLDISQGEKKEEKKVSNVLNQLDIDAKFKNEENRTPRRLKLQSSIQSIAVELTLLTDMIAEIGMEITW
jgi:hypothetical protein